MPDKIPQRLEALSETAHELVQEVNKLNAETNTRVAGVNKRLHRNQKIMWMIIASFIVDIGVTGTVAWAVHTASNATHGVRQVTDRLDNSQQVQRRKVLCPLYQAFKDSKSEKARQAFAKGPKAYDKVFKVIDEGYVALNCSAPLPNAPITPVKPHK
ncbi:MAG: hypothetical protein LC723_06215 [Actinobacteria bacterium]|nr:hypothetical protein [Actinomycetota bacterium]